MNRPRGWENYYVPNILCFKQITGTSTDRPIFYHIGGVCSRMGRERVGHASHIKTLSHSPADNISIKEVKPPPQCLVSYHRLLIAVICNLEDIGKGGIREGKGGGPWINSGNISKDLHPCPHECHLFLNPPDCR